MLGLDNLQELNETVNDIIASSSLEDEITLPEFNSDNDANELISKNIEDAIQADIIKNVDIKETQEVDVPSYLIDIRNVPISQATLMTLKGMLKGGDTSVYIRTSESSVIKVGTGDSYELYMILDDLLRLMYNGACKLYKNTGSGFESIHSMDASSIRLNL